LDPEFLSGILLAGSSSATEAKLVAAIRKNAERPVTDVMYPVEITVNYEDNLVTIIDAIVGYGSTLIPVRKEGEVVGVVRTVEVCEEIGKLLRDETAGGGR
jgi:predicted transcriptional regulator